VLVRHAVRVLLIDEDERVLLVRSVDPATGLAFWFPPGGGLEGDEDAREAAVREVFEETGLADLVLGPEVWQRRHAFTWRGVCYDQSERWFVARVRSFVPGREQLTEEEAEDITEARWWTVGELAATADRLVPDDLAPRLTDLLDGPNVEN
jgi:8-oxo-dGTP pyrophosphatase MutT (NUDIX family)